MVDTAPRKHTNWPAIFFGIILALLLATGGLLAYGYTQRRPAQATGDIPLPPTTAERVRQFAEDGLVTPVRGTRADVIAALGMPIHETATSLPTAEVGRAPDTLVKMTYHGAEVEIYRAAEPPSEQIIRTAVTSRRHLVRWNLNVGASAAQVTRTLGDPGERAADYLRYAPSPERYVVFRLVRGKVAGIEWYCFRKSLGT